LFLSQNQGIICDKMVMKKQIYSIDSKVLSRIYGHRGGWVFTPGVFRDLGNRTAVAAALKRHKQTGLIRQLARGLYDYPRSDPSLGVLTPKTDDIANALRDRDGTRLQPSGAHAANLLGLSEQVPVRVVYLTDGPSRQVQLGRRRIVLQHTTPRNMATAGKVSGLVIQALRWIGQRHTDERKVLSTLRRRLSDADKKQLLTDLRYAPAWIADIMRKVAQPPSR
jgi:hypothetical protein